MYHIFYGIFYLFSLLPWMVLYFISDCFYLLVFYVIRYRRAVVMSNLLIAFPEKSVAERTVIAKQFYKNFLDTFIETVKFLSISDKAFSKRLSGNFELFEELYKTGQNVQIHSGHFFNWEYMNWGMPKYTPYPFIGVYYPITSKSFNKIILDMRQRYGTILLSAHDFKNKFHQLSKSRYALGLYADQSPVNRSQAYWITFFEKLTPFLPGPEKNARINNTAVVFVFHYKVKRGYYRAEFKLVTTTPHDLARGELTKTYVRYLEECIRKKPFNYLWSHKRWKEDYKEAFRRNLIQ